MKNLLRAEEALQFAVCLFLNAQLQYPGWLFWALLITPDLSMIGYAVNARVGAVCYNIVHHKGTAAGIYLAGLYFNSPELLFTGLLLFAHSCMDRVFGYGLKYADDFKNTHLGKIGKHA